MATSSRKSAFHAIRRLLPFLRPYRFWIVLKLLITALTAANDIFMVYIINVLVNSSLSGNKEELLQAIFLMAASVAAGFVMSFAGVYASGRFSAYAIRDMKHTFSAHIDKLPVSYTETRHTGDFSSRMTTGVNAIENFLSGDFTSILFHIFRISVCIVLMLVMNWQLTLLCMVIIAFTGMLTGFINRPLFEYSSKLQQSLAKANADVQDAIGGIHIVKSYTLIQTLNRKFNTLLEQVLANSLVIEKRSAALGAVSVFVNMAPFLIFFLFGGYLVINDQLSVGALLAFAQFINYLVSGLSELPNQWSHYKTTAGVAEHLFELLDEKTERTHGGKPVVSPSAPALEFAHVSFSYDGRKRVLEDVSFSLPQGKTVALVGSSGSGKSTVFKLIAGFYEHREGTVKLFDEPLSDWSLTAARTSIAFVSQETFLYPGSIAENITCGKDGFGMDEIERAAKLANIDDFIRSLPEGYHTHVGERGVRFSGGQRQRISIARAILKDAPILLLDEATSALDSDSERQVQEAINRMMKEKTVLVVAHRLSTVIEADEIIVLDNGRIVENGTHTELLSMNGAYKRLYNNQFVQQESPMERLERGEDIRWRPAINR